MERLPPEAPEYDVCIIGAGPAGLTVASELAYSGLKICVLESGGSSRTQFSDQLKDTEFDGLPIKENSRERVIGGASATWDGRSAPLDEVDFEPRGWPGWPITRDELSRYEAEAVRYRFPSPGDFDVPAPIPSDPSSGPWQDLAVKMFVAVIPPYRFNCLQSIFLRPGVELRAGTTVTRLASQPAGDGGRTVTACVYRTVSAGEAEVRARQFVLASGGIENARILLNSPADSGTLGNEHDQVGRYFMNHPKVAAGLLCLNRPLPDSSPLLDRAIGSKPRYAGLRLAPEIQRARGLLNSYVRLQPNAPIGRDLRSRLDVLRARAHDSNRLRHVARLLGHRWALMSPPIRTLRLRWYLEMEPRSSNRITLSVRTDAFGNRLPHVHYELSARDRDTIVTLHRILEQNIARLNLGRLESSAEAVLGGEILDASHHLGATRMGVDPRTSVVDANCKVHTVTNLYVAGGSVFSAGGCANPTLTIVALAIRLAVHLRSLFVSPGVVVQPLASRASTGFVVVGAGRRISGDVVPSLESHGDLFRVAGIYARTTASVFGPVRRYDVQAMEALTDDALAGARFIYVAVPGNAVVPVLETLQRWPDRELVLDTPVPTTPRALSLLRGFKRVHIAEDSVYLPWLEAVRTFWAANGLTGPVEIEFDRSGYRYHAVALARALCGTAESPAAVLAAERKDGVFAIRLTNGTARIIEPRDYAVGTLRVTRGGITLSSHKADGAVLIDVLTEDGLCTGFDVGGARVLLSRPESFLIGRVAPDDSIVSLMGQLKRVGLARMFAMMAENKIPWTLEQGLDDAKVDQA